MSHYDHRVHAGNAGDVWKHFLLLEAADCLLNPDSCLVYAESHVGRPDYSLSAPGDWEGGIGKCWPMLPSLKNFCYFNILSDFNFEGHALIPKRYLGSARLVLEAARGKGAKLRAHVWDIDPDIAASWTDCARSDHIVFHHADGFSGIESLINGGLFTGLVFIDPPYVDTADAVRAERLMQKAVDSGWIALCWCMIEMKNSSLASREIFELEFARAGLDGGRWKGAAMTVAGIESQQFDGLLDHLHSQTEKLKEALRDP